MSSARPSEDSQGGASFAGVGLLEQSRRLYWTAESIHQFVAFAAAGAPVGRALDAGCGTGLLTEALAAELSVNEILGVDVNPHCISHAEGRRSASAHPERLAYELGDIHHLSYPDGHFDLVVAHYLLVDCQAPGEALAELVRVTKPGGRLCCFEPIFQVDLLNCYMPFLDAELLGRLRRIYEKVIVEIPRKMGLDRTLAPSLPSRFASLQLKDVEAKIYGNYSFTDRYDEQAIEAIRTQSEQALKAQDQARWMLSQHPITQQLTDEEVDSYVETQAEVCRRILADPAAFARSGMFTSAVTLMIRGIKQ